MDPEELARRMERRKRTPTSRVLIGDERSVELYLREQVEQLDGLCLKFVSPGLRGAPDRLVILHGKPVYFIELKQMNGVLSGAQIRYHEQLRQRGCDVRVLWSKEDVDAFILEVTLT
jgi:hypothetical protein